ncbi:tRNA (adenosine(37)-N6)-threonylcarbamoyltransferase complex ATPase subunit type 1 TsaE [Candidatus Falkowbacteria bacterium]|nr:tRNA (adenosine(37)-N6)-threonylcarbamoyltransferase complex ATPase subunit type 1 TsaE [Candidatus Falkowbacteria bacterium]
MATRATLTLPLPDAQATARLGARLAPLLGRADVLLLEGAIGAGKTHFARALILARLAAVGRREDVPSPTFTLVQTYEAGDLEIWHADLYRLTRPDEIAELGLEEAFDSALCLVEWPDRMADLAPDTALRLSFRPDAGEGRVVTLTGPEARWAPVLAGLSNG